MGSGLSAFCSSRYHVFMLLFLLLVARLFYGFVPREVGDLVMQIWCRSHYSLPFELFSLVIYPTFPLKA